MDAYQHGNMAERQRPPGSMEHQMKREARGGKLTCLGQCLAVPYFDLTLPWPVASLLQDFIQTQDS